MDSAVERLLDTVVDGRAEGIRFRQDNLTSLHHELRKESAALTAAQEKDTGASKAEIEAEYFLALEAVRHFYESLDFAKELETEYLVAHGKDNASRRTGAGLVIIRPTTYTRLFSILSPLAGALAAGSVVALECSVPYSPAPLTKTPSASPRGSQMYPSSSKPSSPKKHLPIPSARANHLVSANAARAVAIVDRTADVEAAAKAITAARFGFGGQSPYAPDLVLVNEYVKKDFFEACSKHATLAFARETTVRRTSDNSSDETRKAVQEAEDKRLVSSFGSNDFKLVDIKDNIRGASLVNIKISGRFLPIATSSGLVDSIYTQEFDSITSDMTKESSAGRVPFRQPDAAKYLSQHLPAHISFINQIPSNLLLGPAAPISHEPAFAFRYSKDMFSVARPQFIERPGDAPAMVEQLLSGSGSGAVTAQSLRALALTPLQPTKQPGNSRLGFFEQGFVLSASLIMSVLLPSLAYGTWIGGRRAFDYALKLRG
ncbi:LOW QUALITY PROTEIN: aldehyde dehydrogenase [Colletotrichum tofieldiae]|nr:LOW QUALITY PROTEIN: aldehyde dehydrogenase [Colletotrichum tofieldiae]